MNTIPVNIPVHDTQWMDVVVEWMGVDGCGVAKVVEQNKTKIFLIPFTLPEEKVRILQFVPTKHQSGNYFLVQHWKMLQPSPARKTPVCPHFGVCSGCSLQMLDYQTQWELKKKKAEKIFSKELNHQPSAFYPSKENIHYRVRVSFHCGLVDGKLSFGYLQSQPPFSLVPIASCFLGKASLSEAAQKLCDFITQKEQVSFFELPQRLIVRQVGTKRVFLHLELPPKLMNLWQAKNYASEFQQIYPQFFLTLAQGAETFLEGWGKKHSDQPFSSKDLYSIPETETFPAWNGQVPVPFLGFTQVNPESFAGFLQILRSWVEEKIHARNNKNYDAILEFYAGSSILSFSLRDKAKSFYNLDFTPVYIAGKNKSKEKLSPAPLRSLGLLQKKRLQNFKNRESSFSTLDQKENIFETEQGISPDWWTFIKKRYYYCVDLNQRLPRVISEQDFVNQETLCLVNPPRQGLSNLVLHYCKRFLFEDLFYISCNLSSFLRDYKELQEDYSIFRVAGFDFFPQTPHFESLIWLKAKRRRSFVSEHPLSLLVENNEIKS